MEGDRRLTYDEWDRLATWAAAGMQRAGCRPGDVVSVLTGATGAYPVAVMGAARAGCVVAGINPRLGPREVEHILGMCAPRAVVADRDVAGVATLLDVAGLVARGGAPDPVRRALTDDAIIVFTSGTTGLPKGATFTGAALAAVARIEAAMDPAPSPRGLQAIPMAHMGFMTKLAHFVSRGACAVLVERWSAREALDAIARERLTDIGGVPTQLALMLDEPSLRARDISSLHSVTIGGAPGAPSLVRRIREGFGVPVRVRYSCTELGLATGTRPGDPDEAVAHTVGHPLPGVDLAILDAGEDGVGEIAAWSPAMMRGYWGEPPLVGGTRFRTGDLGRIDDDGRLRIAGRAKEMYIRAGYNVYPLEVENVLREHPRVAAAAVLGAPDAVLGERGVAYVQPHDPLAAPCAEELRAFVAARLATYKVPDEVEMREALPLTPMMKVDKAALRGERAR